MKRRERQEHLDRITDDASAWFERLQDPEVDDRDREAFAAWLKASAEHVQEFLQIAALRSDLCSLGEEPNIDELIRVAAASEEENVVPLFESSAAEMPGRDVVRRRRVSRRRIAGGLVAAAVVSAAIALGVFRLALGPSVFQTTIGEQTSFPLPDGSIVTLNTLSEIEPRFTSTHRDVVLASGEVLFDVVSDPQRPFRVIAGDAVIQAIGTTFNVYHRQADTTVTVVEGTIEIRVSDAQASAAHSVTTVSLNGTDQAGSAASLPLIVTVGQQARLDVHTGQTTVVQANLEQATAWRERRLFFDGRPLSAVIDEFNLYNDPPIVIADPGLGQLPVTGSFNANDRASFVLFLEKTGIATAQIESDGRISLRPVSLQPVSLQPVSLQPKDSEHPTGN